MATEVSRLALAVDSSDVRKATTDLDRFGRAGKDSETAIVSAQRSFAGMAASVAAVGVVAGAAISKYVQLADTYQNLSARLQLVARSATEFAAAQQATFDIAQRTRTGWQETVNLFGSLSRATENLGKSQAETLAVTETINKAIVVSGTASASAAAALVQLGQGFSSGTLRGEELNSILEQAPRLARAIADGLGVGVGELRKLGEQGKLTADAVFGALEKSAGAINAEFEKMPLTVGAASTQLSNAVLSLVGSMDDASGASAGLAKSVSGAAGFVAELADEIRRLNAGDANVGFLAKAFQTTSETVRILGANVAFTFRILGAELESYGQKIKALISLDFDKINQIGENAKRNAIAARNELDRYEREVLGGARNDQSAAESRRLGLTSSAVADRPVRKAPADDSDKKKAKAITETNSAVETYIKSLERQLEREQELSEVEKARGEISRQNIQSRRDQQRIVELAGKIDEAKAIDEAQKAMERAKKSAEEYDETMRRRNETLADGVKRQREEMEELGLTTEALTALKLARIDATIAQEEATLAMDRTAGATERDIELAEQRIKLLREERGILAETGAKQVKIQTDKLAEEAGKTLNGEVKTALSNAFRDSGGNPVRALGDAVKNVLFTRATEGLATALADFLVGTGKGGSSGLFGDLFGGAGSLLGKLFSFDGGGSTGSGARSGGLDGKGGFLAMMHPRETVLDHTKGQGAGGGQPVNITINQTVGDVATVSMLQKNNQQLVRQIQGGFMRSQNYGGAMS